RVVGGPVPAGTRRIVRRHHELEHAARSWSGHRVRLADERVHEVLRLGEARVRLDLHRGKPAHSQLAPRRDLAHAGEIPRLVANPRREARVPPGAPRLVASDVEVRISPRIRLKVYVPP